MTLIERPDSKKFIPSGHFNICLIDGWTKEQIWKEYPKEKVTKRKNCYYIFKFIYHLKVKHNISLIEYCEKYLEIDWPLCPTKGIKVGYKTHGNGLILNKYSLGGISKETCPNFAKGCEKLSKERMGKNNPMYGKEAWNKGLDRTNPVIDALAREREGTKMSEESKNKMRKRRAESPIKARHTTPHSPETVEKLRENTAKLWAEGRFNRTTSIHIKMREFLKTLDLKEKPQEEYQVKYYSLDFALPDAKVGIECQGTYYHIDPRIYPNGPKDKIQRRNFGRDKAKRTYLTNRGWVIIECWETEINDGSFKEFMAKKLKELGLF